MAQVNIPEEALRQMLKQALVEALDERRDLLHDVLAEVLEEVGLAEAIRDGQQTERVNRDEVFSVLRGTS